MLKRYKNGFIELIENHGLDTNQFKHHEKEVDEHPAFILQLKNSPLFFMTRTSSHDYHSFDLRYIKFAPNFPKSDHHPPDHFQFPEGYVKKWLDIESVYQHFEAWLRYHIVTYIDESNTADMWEQIEGKHLFSTDPLADRTDETFTKIEKKQLRATLQQFQQTLENEFHPTKKQITVISDRLEYLSDSIDRVNKVDWQGLAISTVISISVALSLDTERGKALFELFKNSLSSTSKLLGG